MKTTPSSKWLDPYYSLIAFSIYSGIIGAVLLFSPRRILPPFKIYEVVNSFTFMLGLVLLCSSFYYLASGISKDRNFAILSVVTRFVSPIGTIILYASGEVPITFVILGILDATGGFWTLIALRMTGSGETLKSKDLVWGNQAIKDGR